MYVLDNVELKNEILDDGHISAYAIHPGGTKMYLTIRPFYFGRVRKEKSLSMSASQSLRKKLFGLMQQVPVPQWKWENVTMNFVYKLPRTQDGYDGN